MNSQPARNTSVVRCVYARVTLDRSASREEIFKRLQTQPGHENWQPPISYDRLTLRVTLSAEDSVKRRVEATGSFLIAGPRCRLAASWRLSHGLPLSVDHVEQRDLLSRRYPLGPTIADKINIMLGRAPQLHQPPKTAWGHLIAALTQAGVATTQDELIASPLMVELDEEVEALLLDASEPSTGG